MIDVHCTIIPVVVLDRVLVFVIAHTSAWFLDRELHQLVAYFNLLVTCSLMHPAMHGGFS